jgi:hypothetical protein
VLKDGDDHFTIAANPTAMPPATTSTSPKYDVVAYRLPA